MNVHIRNYIGTKNVDEKTNEISTIQELIKKLNIKGYIVVLDALHYQKETVKIIKRGI